MDGIRVKIHRQEDLIGTGVFGHAEGNTITLYPDAFRSREDLVKTLAHERTHIWQYQVYGQPLDDGLARAMEQGAYGIEHTFWEYYSR